jgi:RNA polymerase sigma factor (sigma-70 family)
MHQYSPSFHPAVNAALAHMRESSISHPLPVNDPSLASFIDGGGISRAQQIETLVIDHARPTMERIIARFMYGESLYGEDADDIVATVTLRLIRKLQSTEISDADPIRQFDSYVARLTYNTIYDYMRRRFPERTRLKNRLRYIASNDERLAIWSAPAGTSIGLAKWRGDEHPLEQVELGLDHATSPMLDRARPADAVVTVVRAIGAPVLLATLTATVAVLWGVTDADTIADDALVDCEPTPLQRLESREFFGALWEEILELRPAHRAALLLNLRDPEGLNAVALLVLAGIATFDEIAEGLEISPVRFAELWPNLPLDDLTIAAMLGVTRQQIINYRSSARERLTRRMARRFPGAKEAWTRI